MMRKPLLAGLILLSVVAIAVVRFAPVVFAEVDLNDRIVGIWNNSVNNTNFVSYNPVEFSDNQYDSGMLLAYVTWITPADSGEVYVASVPFGFELVSGATRYGVMIDDDFDSETGDVEYIFSADLYKYEGNFSGSVQVDFDGTVTNATIDVVGLAGVTATGAVSTYDGFDSYLEHEEYSADDTKLPLLFASYKVPPSEVELGQDTYDISTTYSTFINSGAFGAIHTDVSDPISITFGAPGEPELADYVAVGVDVIFEPDSGSGFYVEITAGPDVSGSTVTLSGFAEIADDNYWIDNIYYYINFDNMTYLSPLDGSFDSIYEEFDLQIDDLAPGHYVLEFYASATDGENSTCTEGGCGGDGPLIVEFDVEDTEEEGDPDLFILVGPTDPLSSYIYVEGEAGDINGNIIDAVYYSINGDAPVNATPVDGAFDSDYEQFIIGPLGPYFNGTSVDLTITAENDIGGSATNYYYDLVINNSSPVADCELTNHPTPTADTTPTHVITCSSPDNIIKMEYRIINEELGEQVAWTDIEEGDLSSGSYGTSEVSAIITPAAPLPDGNTSIGVNVFTGTGRSMSERIYAFTEAGLPMDVFVIEARDDNAPTIKLNPILPNPITATSPFITGSCQDVHPFDTNSTIAVLQYRIDAGSWEALPPLNAPLDSAIEYFSYQLPEQTLGEHVVEVRCADSDGNDTNVMGGNQTLEFEIITQPDVEPEDVIVTEDFTTNALNSVNETTAIWGNGYIRLTEEIDFNKVLIDGDGFVSRYGTVFSTEYPLKGYGDDIWYAVDFAPINGYELNAGLRRYNTQTQTITDYPEMSAVRINDFEIFEHEGTTYAIYSTFNGLTIKDVSQYAAVGLAIDGGTGSVIKDPRNPLGFYVGTIDVNDSEEANTVYIDLNDTPLDRTDDLITWYSSTPGFDMTNINRLIVDDNNNIVYMAQFGTGIVRIDDNGTPLNLADDTRFLFDDSYIDDIAYMSGMVKDPNDDGIFLTTHSNKTRLFYLDVNGTPTNPNDDEFIEIADEFQMFQQRVDNLVFLEGPQYIGGQLFMMTRTGKLLYYNTNGSYSNPADDTAILLQTNEGLYPEYISDIYIADYNTIYASFQHTGMTRIDLNRSWEDVNDAVTITIPPEVRLVINNINLEDVIVGPLVEDEDGSIIGNEDGIGIQYFVSLNDGVDYVEVDVGELANFLESGYEDLEGDYRLKVKITLTKIGENSRTPVIEGFTIAYGAYTEETPVPALAMTPSAFSFTTEQQFTLDVRVVDELGYLIPTFNGPVDLQLLNSADDSPAAGFSHTTVNLVNGAGSINNAQITQAGQYRVYGEIDGVSSATPHLIVTNPPVDEEPEPELTPTMLFYANRYAILPGETATIYWSTSNLSNVTLTDHGVVAASGSVVVSPESTKLYVLSGTTPSNNAMSSGLTITVLGIGDEPTDPTEPIDPEPTDPEVGPTLVVTPETVTVQKGGKVQISWVATDAEDVFIDYTNTTGSPIGSFEFFPTEDIVITITARNGERTVSKQVKVFVTEQVLTEDNMPNVLDISSPTVPGIAAIASLFTVAVLNGGLANYAAIFFGFIVWRKRKYWGIVFDMDTFEPLSLVTVRIYHKTAAARVFVAQTVTDLEGRYGINVTEAGNYTVEFVREGYNSLLKEISIVRNEDVVLDVGMREASEVEGGFGGIRYFWKQNAAGIMQLLRIAIVALMTWGLSLTLGAISQDPSFANYLVAGLYLIVLLLQIVIILEPYFGRKVGAVIDADTRRPIHGAVLRLLDVEKDGRSVENVGISNAGGVIKLRVPRGNYQFMASRAGYSTAQGTTSIDASGKLTKLIALTKGAAGEATKFGT